MTSFEEFEANPPRTEADLEKLAQKQVAPAAVPEGYLSQLRAHLKEFPHDFLYHLTPFEGNGFGMINCLEPGCSSYSIPLKPRTKRPDGGRSTGVGGLSEFQQHIIDHEDHEALRDRRVARREERNSASPIPQRASESRTSQAAVQPITLNLDTEVTKPNRLTPLDNNPNLSRPPSSSRSQSTASKRTPSSPPTSSRPAKKMHMTPGRSGASSKPMRQAPVIDLSSSDDNLGGSSYPRTSTSSPSKQRPAIIDVDTSDGDSDPKITTVKTFGKSTAPIEVDDVKPKTFGSSKPAIDVDDLKTWSDDDDPMVWLDSQGFVPSAHLRNPKPSVTPVPTSRLSSSILHGRSSATPTGSMADRKPNLPGHLSSHKKPTPKSRLEAVIAGSPYEEMKRHLGGDRSLKAEPHIKASSLFFSSPQVPSPSTSALANFKRESTAQLFGNHGGPASGIPFMKADPFGDHKPSGSQFPKSNPYGDQKPSGIHNPWAHESDEDCSDDDPSHVSNLMDPVSRLLAPNMLLNSLNHLDPTSPYYSPPVRLEDSHEFLTQAVQNMNFTHNATVAGARQELGLVEGEEPRLEGLQVLLMPHQLIGVAWMIKQEKSKNMGGILGDEMGLGKTIQMIATMVKNRSEDSKIKATLILAPLALLSQWKEEIAERSTCDLSVLIYHSSTKVAERKKVSNYDVVITTLDTLRGDWWDDEDSETPKKPRGLYKIDWYRVVIDEAQIIRNRQSKKSRAVCALKSVYRWCLTGTPIFNSLWDIYPYLRFLRIRPYNDHHRFRDHISRYEKKKPNLAAQRAQAVLGTCMLRRQKNSKLDGKPLIVLPPKHEEDVMLPMSPDEREIYDMLEKKAQRKFNVFLRRGTVLKNFACILVLLLRLRQACGHPGLAIEEDANPQNVDDSADPEFADPESELARAIQERGQEWVDNTKKKFEAEAEELVKAELQDRNEAAAPECPICNDPLDDTSRITACGHVFCEGCLDTLLMQPRTVMDDETVTDPNKITKPCPNCRAPFRRLDTYLKSAFLPPADKIEDDDNEELPDSGVTLHRKMRNGILDDSDDDDQKSSAKGKEKEICYRSEFVPSTKLAWLLKQIEDVKKENPTDKIIVVSQWTSMLAICGTFLRERGLRFVSYQGDMNTVERNQAVKNFKTKPEYSIMLMSLKCGGVGLNLTCANRVVSLDLAWSPASEKQAFDRAHRFGQEKPVYVKRVMLIDTVEQRICNLQKNKQDITDSTLGEGTGKKLKRMTVSELASLFNLNSHGETLS
ncbi:hypothetical protein PGT21_024810 [Puccinia graminis f. sp. tritici]|uniref:DNA helicase rad5 n=1 Tax=Puccinia graminis f. sp. tritici TaxID=56615 RepID=A0A5B0QNG6_PUCGR|nr:hypothetical protein PGT21_024810 [Puccinia graminis f. sp. tritici]